MATGALPPGITRYRDRYRVRLDVDGATHALGVFDTLHGARAALDTVKGVRARSTFVPPAQIRAEQRAFRIEAEAEAFTLGTRAEQWLEGPSGLAR